MKIVEPSFAILKFPNGEDILRLLEMAGRTCYKSEDKITADSAKQFVKMLLGRKHESVIEHESITVRIICDRGVSHELVRHRLCSFSQESTRYVSYDKGKFGSEITVILPCFWDDTDLKLARWQKAMQDAEDAYMSLMAEGASPQEARSVLPNSLKTEVVMTANLREWRHIFKLRTSQAAHPQMREIMIPMLEAFKMRVPIIFDDIEVCQ